MEALNTFLDKPVHDATMAEVIIVGVLLITSYFLGRLAIGDNE